MMTLYIIISFFVLLKIFKSIFTDNTEFFGTSVNAIPIKKYVLLYLMLFSVVNLVLSIVGRDVFSYVLPLVFSVYTIMFVLLSIVPITVIHLLTSKLAKVDNMRIEFLVFTVLYFGDILLSIVLTFAFNALSK